MSGLAKLRRSAASQTNDRNGPGATVAAARQVFASLRGRSPLRAHCDRFCTDHE